MGKDYRSVAGVPQDGQKFCWAACMEWWLTYMSPKRTIVRQPDFFGIDYIYDYTVQDGANSGGITREGINRLFDYPPFQMRREIFAIGEVKFEDIAKKLKYTPVVIAYTSSTGLKHFNVIVDSYDVYYGGGVFMAMEPEYGAFTRTFFSQYNTEGVVLGWAEKNI